MVIFHSSISVKLFKEIMSLNKKVSFTLFPIGYWVVLLVGVVFHFLQEVSQLGNVLINLASFLLAFKAAIIIHEAGHLIAAKAVGGTPRRMVDRDYGQLKATSQRI